MTEPSAIQKTCTTCRVEQPTTNFFRNRSKKDGLSSLCKACSTKLIESWRATPRGMISVSRHNKKPRDKTIQHRWRKTPAGRVYRIKAQKAYRTRHPERYAAREAVHAAVECGRIPQAKTLTCTRCHKAAREYHHHQGYKPDHHLHVLPVCKPCHHILDK